MQKKCLLAFEAMLYIASQPGTKAVSLKEICKSSGVAERYLEKMMQQLVHSGILRGVRGPKGGYLLAKERRRISLKEIYETVNRGDDEKESASKITRAVIKPLAKEIDREIGGILSRITIEDLYERASRSGLDKEFKKTSDFNI